jgi:hypothetical protein
MCQAYVALQCTESIIMEQSAVYSMSQQADTNSTRNVVNEIDN